MIPTLAWVIYRPTFSLERGLCTLTHQVDVLQRHLVTEVGLTGGQSSGPVGSGRGPKADGARASKVKALRVRPLLGNLQHVREEEEAEFVSLPAELVEHAELHHVDSGDEAEDQFKKLCHQKLQVCIFSYLHACPQVLVCVY